MMKGKSVVALTEIFSKRARSSRCWVAWLGFVALSCSHQTHVQPPDLPVALAPECLEYAHVQEALADLGLQAMQSFGRIDPQVYVRSEQGELLPNPELEKVPFDKRAAFDAALARVNGESKAKAALQRGYAYASAGCAYSSCSTAAYSITVERNPTGVESDRLYHWKVTGSAVPTISEWKAFESMYAPRPPFCPVLASLLLSTPRGGVAQTSGLFDQEHRVEEQSALNPCKCKYGGQPGYPSSPCTSCASSGHFACPTDI